MLCHYHAVVSLRTHIGGSSMLETMTSDGERYNFIHYLNGERRERRKGVKGRKGVKHKCTIKIVCC
jgi:hypothetical protein